MSLKNWGKLTKEQQSLVEEYYYLVKYYMNIKHLSENAIDDYHGFLSESLIKSVMMYTPNDACSLKTYILNMFNTNLRLLNRYNNRQCRKCEFGNNLSMQAILYQNDNNMLIYNDVLGETDCSFDSVELWSVYNKILSGFSDRDKKIINLYFIYQMTTREIEAVSSISRSMVSVITKKFINNIKKELIKN